MMQTFDVRDYGAVANSGRVQTQALQAAIDACRDAGGGVVELPAGVFISGSLRLYSHIELHLAQAAVLRGSQALTDYSDFHQPSPIAYLYEAHYITAWHLPPNYFHALISAFDAEDVSIVGEPGSVIDGAAVTDPAGEEGFRGPMGIVFNRVKNVRLTGYTVVNSSNWAHTLAACDGVQVADVAVFGGHDGFDLHHSQHVTIQHCHLACGDDCFAGYDVADVLIADCLLNTACNVTGLSGQHIQLRDCQLVGPGRYAHLAVGTHETHALAKYYALACDANRPAASDLAYANLQLRNLARLIMYRRGDADLLQDGAALDALSLTDVVVDGLAEASVVEGRGQRVALTLTQCRITPPQAAPLLVIDDAVDLTISQTVFTKPTVIETTAKQRWTFMGLTNFSRNVLA